MVAYIINFQTIYHNGLIRGQLIGYFPERWIDRGGPLQCPPRSPDLTNVDLCADKQKKCK